MADLAETEMDAIVACLSSCVEVYGPDRPRHAPECRYDDITELVDEVRRLRDGIRRYLACDGSDGRFDALELADVRDELRALLDQENDR